MKHKDLKKHKDIYDFVFKSDIIKELRTKNKD